MGFWRLTQILTLVTYQNTVVIMIKSFQHKGLNDFFFTGIKKGIIPEHSFKLARILDRLDASLSVNDMDLPGFNLHQLSGKEKDIWSVSVNRNWRVTFHFKDGDAYFVDYCDYHQELYVCCEKENLSTPEIF